MSLLMVGSGVDEAWEREYHRDLVRAWKKKCGIFWHVEIQGNVVRFFRTNVLSNLPPVGSRASVGPWSTQSKMRLLRFLNRIDYESLGPSRFVTLTYPDDKWGIEYAERVDQRNAFHQKAERHFGKKLACIWRIEWEERKSGRYTGNLAPHFHLMILGVDRLGQTRCWRWWNEIVGGGVSWKAINSRKIYNVDGVGRYLSKYVAKHKALDVSTYVNSGIKFGRHWGIRRPELIPMAPISLSRQLSTEEIAAIQAYAEGQWGWYDKDVDGGFTLLGADRAKGFGEWLGGTGQQWW
jgi:hypothetical protein